MSGTEIELSGVTKSFPAADRPAVAPMDLTMRAGEITVLIGPSGCGKTTTLRMVNRLIEPTGGTITIDGVDIRDQSVTALRRGIGYVIQQIGLFPHRTIAQNIATVPALVGWDKTRTRGRVEELADLVGIDRSMLHRYPGELSGGQQQRVGVARALAADPPVLLMDEPFGAVDPIVRAHLREELLALQDRLHKTIVLVTHDIDEAVALADRVVVLNMGGVVEQAAPPDELLAEPANEFVAEFVGHERSIKRLALSRVRDLVLTEGPVVDVEAPSQEARAVLTRTGSAWLGLTSGGRFLGWVPATDLVGENGHGPVPDLRPGSGTEVSSSPSSPSTSARSNGAGGLGTLAPQAPAAQVRPSSTLREALEVILTARSSTAVVLNDDGSYGGTITLEAIREGLGR